MGIRSIPFFKGKKGWQFAGGGQADGGGGGAGNIPIATASTLGGVIIGSGLNITSEGVLSSGGNFSTTPIDTGYKTHDGKTIYARYHYERNTAYDFSTDVELYGLPHLVGVFGYACKTSEPNKRRSIYRWYQGEVNGETTVQVYADPDLYNQTCDFNLLVLYTN